MADHSKPTTTSTYVNFVSELDGRLDDISLGLDPATTSPTNLATNAIRWTSASNKWQKYNGTTWADLSSAYSINIDGTVGATTPASGAFTTLSATGNVTLGDASGDTVTINGTVGAGVVISGSTATDALRITQTGAGNALVVEDSTNPDSSPFVIDTTGVVISGATSASIPASGGALIQSNGTGNGGATIGAFQYSAASSSTAFGGQLALARSKSGTTGTQSIVTTNDWLGNIYFQGSDGANFIVGASIGAAVDATTGSNDMPGRLVFSTTADGASSVTERMRIDSSGNVGIGTNSPSYKLDVKDGAIRVNNSTSTDADLRFANSASTAGKITYTSQDMAFTTAGSERMRIDSSGRVGIGTSSPAVKLAVSSTDAILVPVGTTAQRPTGATGYIRYNTSTSSFEGHNGTAWGNIGGGATGGGTDTVFYLNSKTVSTTYSIPSGQNASCVGPITVSSGATVTVPSGSRWVVL